jgi:hypothetical protein
LLERGSKNVARLGFLALLGRKLNLEVLLKIGNFLLFLLLGLLDERNLVDDVLLEVFE